MFYLITSHPCLDRPHIRMAHRPKLPVVGKSLFAQGRVKSVLSAWPFTSDGVRSINRFCKLTANCVTFARGLATRDAFSKPVQIWALYLEQILIIFCLSFTETMGIYLANAACEVKCERFALNFGKAKLPQEKLAMFWVHALNAFIATNNLFMKYLK